MLSQLRKGETHGNITIPRCVCVYYFGRGRYSHLQVFKKSQDLGGGLGLVPTTAAKVYAGESEKRDGNHQQ